MSTSSDYVFDLDAGHVCLDFANTDSASSGEHLNTYADLLAFARQAQLLTPDDVDRLQQQAQHDEAGAEDARERALTLRSAIRGIFLDITDGRSATEDDLYLLNEHLSRALRNACIAEEPSDDGPRFRWDWTSDRLERPVWAIARSAAELLANAAELKLVHQCGGSTCEWLFLDTSKNRSRQWCSMQSCGNREKARRHYQRVKAAKQGASGAPT